MAHRSETHEVNDLIPALELPNASQESLVVKGRGGEHQG
jgi:hypothetical protein